MKKVYVIGLLMGTLVATVPAFAFQYVDGHRTLAFPLTSQVEIGGKIFDVKADPQTIEEMQNTVAYLQAQVDEALSAQNALRATSCDN